MKRLAFIAFSVAAALSLPLCVALLAVWLAVPSSGFRIEWGRVDMARPSRSRYQVRVVGGQVEFSRRFLAVTAGPNSTEADDYRRAFQFEIDSYALRPRVERVGDVTRTVSTVDHWTYTTFPNNPAVSGYESYWAAHDWLLAAAAAVLPTAWVLRWTSRRKGEREADVSRGADGHAVERDADRS
jgi:hypothetical protein